MIVSRTPFRISFFGGGTDFPIWYNKHGGSVISSTIDKYCYINLRKLPPFFNYKYSIRYREREVVNSISKIKHPSVKHCFQTFLSKSDCLELVHHADLPDRSGIGSSSSFTVGLLNCIFSYKNKNISKRNLALSAINIEQNKIKENVGSQDQTAASYGGLNKINFSRNKEIIIKKILMKDTSYKKLNDSLVLFFTGFSRNSSEVTKHYLKNMKNNESKLNEISQITNEAFNIFQSKDINIAKLGFYLNESWKLKRNLSNKVSNELIDKIYQKGIINGALGGKLLGAGSGGFICFLVEPNEKKKFISKFNNLLHIPINLENSGSKIIYNNENLK
tara:strand:+ start:1384 stop:2382 length:999 start_codon:yes stop_codon:yes gene_type:complete